MISNKSVCVIDYGVGNVNSVKNAFNMLGVDTKISSDEEIIRKSSHLVLPGVGSFGEAMKNLEKRNLINLLLDEVISKKKNILGICLGMQLFATMGHEHGEYKGLNLIQGHVRKIDTSHSKLRLPHIGWNEVEIQGQNLLTSGFTQNPIFYFVHSYQFIPKDKSVIAGICEYGEEIVSILEQGNVFGTQFHPEKSHTDGIKILENFLKQ